jgi:hypothetical protein
VACLRVGQSIAAFTHGYRPGDAVPQRGVMTVGFGV